MNPTTLTPHSGLEQFEALLDELAQSLKDLLDMSGAHFEDINARNSGFVVIGWNKWQWDKLPDDAAPLVGRARKALRTVSEFCSAASRQAPDLAAMLHEIEERVSRLIEQPNGSHPGGAPAQDIQGIRKHAEDKIGAYRECFQRLPSAYGTSERLLVVDTSAMLDRPDLQEWRLDGEPWTVILLPQLHSELDERKRDPRTRDAAMKAINQIEDLDRRGDTFAGVPLVEKIKVREVPISPDMNETLPWLRDDSPDDAFVAGALTLVWEDLTARVALTASDRNLRNKARLAGLGVVHPREL